MCLDSPSRHPLVYTLFRALDPDVAIDRLWDEGVQRQDPGICHALLVEHTGVESSSAKLCSSLSFAELA